MFLCYADETGDVGLDGTPSRYFGLSAIVVHELRWLTTLNAVVEFRQGLRQRYGLKLREEIHAGQMLNHPGDLARIPKSIRLRLLRDCLDFQAGLADISIINIAVDKQSKQAGYDVFDHAWRALLQRFHNGMSYQAFPGPKNADDKGLLISDRTEEAKLRQLARRLRRFNPVPSRGGGPSKALPMELLVEDPVHRDSAHSFLIQLADVNSYFLKQSLEPAGYVRRQGARHWFNRLEPVLYKQASKAHPLGVVML